MRRAGLVLGAAGFVALLALPPPAGLSEAGWRVAALAFLMEAWWVGEAVPVAVTALLPLIVLPILGVGTIEAVAGPFANPVIFLFLGGLLLAAAVERCGLHRRLVIAVLARLGDRPGALLAGFLAVTALMSTFVSNTATTMMMLPMAVSVIAAIAGGSAASVAAEEAHRRFAAALMLGVAYAASIGGMGTLIGTPPNAVLAGFMKGQYGIEVGFAQWMLLGVPLVLLYLPLSWWILARVAFRLVDRTDRGGAAALSAARAALGPWTAAERRVGAVASSVTLLWIIRPLVATPEFGRVSDTAIALVGALVLFALPGGASGRLLDWATTRGIPWGVLLLFGGGLSLADAVARTGLADWIGGGLGTLADWPPLALILALTTLVVALSEFASNTALIATMLPVVGALADGLGLAPLVLAVPATLAASCAFMLPVATPPNAIVYAAGHLRMRDMLWAGLLHNIVGVVLITLLSALLQPRVLP